MNEVVSRYDTLFQIGYSIRLEKMQAMFLARIDRFINFSLMLLGAAVITTVFPVATGIAIAALGGFSFVYQPGVKSILALGQKQRYEKLLSRAGSLNDGELYAFFLELQESDSQVIGSLMCPAHMGELIRLNQSVDFTLSPLEKIMAFIAGDLPKPPQADHTSSA